MSAKVWSNLTKHLQKFLSDHMEKSEVETVMESWGEQKSAVLKLIGVSASKRKAKDPNAPKKFLTSYIFYCNDVRNEVKAENPDMKATEITRELGKRWKTLTAKQKKKYEKLSAEDKLRYEEEMKNYTPPDPSELEEKKSRKKKERTGPKRPTTAYFYYCADVRPQLKEDHPDKKITELSKMMGAMWKELPDEEKQLFNDLAAQDKKRYMRECEEAGIPTKAEKKTATKKTSTKKAPAKGKTTEKKTVTRRKKQPEPELEEDDVTVEENPKPKKAASRKKGGKQKTGYVLFCQEHRPSLKEGNPKWKGPQVTKELSRMWSGLTDEERDDWNDRAMGEPVTK